MITEATQQIISPHTLVAVGWEAPENIDKFDLEHFNISVSVFERNTGETFSLNGTSTDLKYHFIAPIQSNIHATVTAISKCSLHSGDESDRRMWPIKDITTTDYDAANEQTDKVVAHASRKESVILINGMIV